MFERNRHGQLVYIPTVERMSRDLGVSIQYAADLARLAARHVAHGVYRDNERMILPTPSNFEFTHLRAQDSTPERRNGRLSLRARLKSDTAYHERNED